MSTRKEFEIAFEIITEGDRAEIPAEYKRALGPNPERMMRAIRSGPRSGSAARRCRV